jgi:methyltransferase (TIGR00027 family)
MTGIRIDPTSTAEGAAALRAAGAAEADPLIRNPDALAADFISSGLSVSALAKVPGLRRLLPRIAERIIPGAYPYEIARTMHVDRLVREEIRRGISELVLLGAGYDSRPYRLSELADVRVLEVDLPKLSAVKRAKVRSIVGTLPPNVAYVATDFTREDLGERLVAHGHDLSAPVLFVWSGVAPYLPADTVADVLRFVASHRSARTSICFDYCFREALDGGGPLHGAAELRARVERMGEPLRSGIPRGKVREYVEGLGLRLAHHLGPEELSRRYLMRSDGVVCGRPYGFMALAHARARGISGCPPDASGGQETDDRAVPTKRHPGRSR